MKNSFLFILCIVLISLVLTGCNGLGGGGQSIQDIDVYSGLKGITLEFLDMQPPSEILLTKNDDSSAYVSDGNIIYMKIANRGAYQIPDNNGILVFSGFNPSIVTFDDPTGAETIGTNNDGIVHGEFLYDTVRTLVSLNPKSKTYPEGEEQITLITNKLSFTLPIETEFYDFNLKATACYPYKTFATGEVCVDPDIINNNNDACRSSDISLKDQGAPVALKKIEIDNRNNLVIFMLEFKNVGGGDVLTSGITTNEKNCLSPEMNKRNVIKITSMEFGTDDVTSCVNKEVRLYDGKGEIFCTYSMKDRSENSAFKTTLSVEFEYGYRNSVSKKIALKTVNN